MSKSRFWVVIGVLTVIGLTAACSSGGDDAPEIKNANLEVGDTAPDFRLPEHKGGYVRLSDYEGQSNVVIAFYPAAFTPV